MANVIKHKRGSGSDPVANNLVIGELAIRTDNGKLFTKMDSGAIAEIAGGGSDIAINTLSSSSATGGGSATFNGSAYRFTLSSPPSVSAAQLLVSVNGVIQKPVAGTGQPSEGFSVDGNDIIFGDAPATGADFFILTFRSLGVSEPADNSVTSAKIVDGAIVNADINASAAIAGTKISPDFGSQNIVTTGTLSLATVAGTNTNASLNILFQTASGVIDGGSALTYNPAQDVLSVNGNHISRQVFRGDGALGMLTCDNHSSTTFVNVSNTVDISTVDNATDAFTLKQGSNEYITVDTNNSSELITLGNTTTNPKTAILGGNVGIGTTSPSSALHVDKGLSGSPLVTFHQLNGNSSADAGLEVETSSTGTYIQRWLNSGSEKMRVTGVGNVGIGETAPANLLHVKVSDTGVNPHTSAQIVLERYGTNYLQFLTSRTGTSGILFGDEDDNDVAQIKYDHNVSAMQFVTNGTERIRVTNGGLDPNTDAVTDLGNSSKRWRDLYVSSGVFIGGTSSSEELDDYEEGTWTPSFYPLSSGIPITYTTRQGKYTKIGNVVYWHCKIQVSNITGNRNQSFGISGFPHNITNSQAQVSGNFYGETWDGEIPTTLKYFGNVNRGQLYYYSDTMKYFQSSMLDININSSMLMGSGFYYTN